MSPEASVIVGGVGLSAGLDKVTVTLVLAMLASELVSPVHINGVGITIRHKVDVNILANEIVHRPNLLCNEAANNKNEDGRTLSLD